MAGSNLGETLESPPSDGITSLRFSSKSDLLLASSWDGTVRCYNTTGHKLQHTITQQVPVLDATFEEEDSCLTANLDKTVKKFHFPSGQEYLIGSHSAPVRCVEWLAERKLIASGSWDGSLSLWDSSSPQGQNLTTSIQLPGKVFSMSLGGNMLALATSQRQILAFDIRRIESQQVDIKRESPLKFQTRCLQCFPDGLGYAVSSVEGRVAIEYFENSESAQARKFAFKCHRTREGDQDVANPVNAIAFHPSLGTFATGGCDGVVNMWDPENKKRLFQISGYATSIAALAFDRTGTQLAVAASYTFEKGELDHPPDAIYLRAMQESEVKPKPRK